MRAFWPLLLTLLLLPSSAHTLPWPGETWQESQTLTHLDSDFNSDLSGAHWNPVKRELWIADNGGKFFVLVEDAEDNFVIGTRDGKRGEWAGAGDAEGITQVDYNNDEVYVMTEGVDIIKVYDTSVYGTTHPLRQWHIGPHVPTSGGAGSEGIAFVPDEWLTAHGFVDASGNAYLSQLGMGGLMMVSHQNGGRIYAFDLDPDGDNLRFVGAYKTGATESSGLEFDRSNGLLYAWHNVGTNSMEELDLGSTMVGSERKLNSRRIWTAPRTGNLEGIAFTPAKSHEYEAFITDDDNQTGKALMRYRQFKPHQMSTDVHIAASADDAEQGRKGAVNLTSTALEITYNEVNQAVGLRFASAQLPPKAHITSAYITFTTAAPPITKLQVRGQRAVDAGTFTEAVKDISARPKTRAQVEWAEPAWNAPVGSTRRSPELRDIVQEQVNLPDWTVSSPIVIIIWGYGHRVVHSYDSDSTLAPRLHIEYTP